MQVLDVALWCKDAETYHYMVTQFGYPGLLDTSAAAISGAGRAAASESAGLPRSCASLP